MMLTFTKMHGLGNDYLFIDVRAMDPNSVIDWNTVSVMMSDRHFGVGADGIILIGVSQQTKAIASMRIFNADGSESEMCGNGLRAMTKWLYDRKEWQSGAGIETGAGLRFPEILEHQEGRAVKIRVNMGRPALMRSALGMQGNPDTPCLEELFDLGDRTVLISCVSMGNPHLMVFGPLWDVGTMERYGSLIENHEMFLHRINVHSVEVVDANHLRIRHWERGSGLTLACGTGSAAALVAAVLGHGVNREAQIDVPGGQMHARWDEASGDVYLTGPAAKVFEGRYWVPEHV